MNNKTIRVAVIDVGTLKSKFEIKEFDENMNSKTLLRKKKLTVLGRDLDKNDGNIIDKSISITCEALKEFADDMKKFGVKRFKAVTTEAIRKAKNSNEVLQKILDTTGIQLDTMTHKEEAEIYFRAVSRDFPGRTIAVADIGGGSVQVVFGKDAEIYETHLFKTGTYFMQENFSNSHHPTKEELENAMKYISKEMESLKKSAAKPELLVYGTTNIIDFLEAMKIDLISDNSNSLHSKSCSVSALRPVYEEIIKYSYEDRMSMYPDEPYYMWAADKALMNVFQICDYCDIDKVVPSNSNISYGLLLQIAENE